MKAPGGLGRRGLMSKCGISFLAEEEMRRRSEAQKTRRKERKSAEGRALNNHLATKKGGKIDIQLSADESRGRMKTKFLHDEENARKTSQNRDHQPLSGNPPLL